MNGEPAQAPPNRTMRRLKGVALSFIGLIALYAGYHLILSLVIQSQINSIHRAGFPVTCAELDKWYVQPPAGQNAADLYAGAFAHYQTWTNKPAELSVPTDATNKRKFSSRPRSKQDLLPIVGFAKLPPRTEPLSREMHQLVTDYLSDNSEALRLLHQIPSEESCRYPVDLTKGMAMRLSHLTPVRQASRLLSLEAIQCAEEQKPWEAVESIAASLGVSRSLEREPSLISFLVRLACQSASIDGLERILNRVPLADAQLSRMALVIGESSSTQMLTRAFIGERCCGYDCIDGLRSGRVPLADLNGVWDEETLPIHNLWALYKSAGLLKLDEEKYLDIMGAYIEATRLQPPENIRAATAVNDRVNQLSRWHVLTRTLLPELDKAVEKAERCDARMRDARTAIAVERYRAANGELPDKLGDLVPSFLPAVPADPYDGKPLRYKKLTKGYVVYSVGADREDNGGRETDSGLASWVAGTDITFTTER